MLTLILLRLGLVQGVTPNAVSTLVVFPGIKQQQIIKKIQSVVQLRWGECRHFKRISGRALLNGLNKAFNFLWTWKKNSFNLQWKLNYEWNELVGHNSSTTCEHICEPVQNENTYAE